MPSGWLSTLPVSKFVSVIAFAEAGEAAVAPMAAIAAAKYLRLRLVPFTVEPPFVGRDGIVPPAWWSDSAPSGGFG